MTSVLEGRELVVLREGRRILDLASILVTTGEGVGIEGPSGSGKNTLARALANAPEVLILDEPTAALDPDAGERIVALLRALSARGLSLVMVTHVEAHARALGGTRYRCERGRLFAPAGGGLATAVLPS